MRGESQQGAPADALQPKTKKDILAKIKDAGRAVSGYAQTPTELTQSQQIKAVNLGLTSEEYLQKLQADAEAKIAKKNEKKSNKEMVATVNALPGEKHDMTVGDVKTAMSKDEMAADFKSWQENSEKALPKTKLEAIRKRETARNNIADELKFYSKIASNLKDLLPLAQAKNLAGLEQQLVAVTGRKEWSANIVKAFEINSKNKKNGLMYTINDGLSAVEELLSDQFPGEDDAKFKKQTEDKIDELTNTLNQEVIAYQEEEDKKRQNREDNLTKLKAKQEENAKKRDAQKAEKVAAEIRNTGLIRQAKERVVANKKKLESDAMGFTAADLAKQENRDTLQNALKGYVDQLKQNFGITWTPAGVSGGVDLYQYLLKNTKDSPNKPGFMEKMRAKLSGWDKFLPQLPQFEDLTDKIITLQDKLSKAPSPTDAATEKAFAAMDASMKAEQEIEQKGVNQLREFARNEGVIDTKAENQEFQQILAFIDNIGIGPEKPVASYAKGQGKNMLVTAATNYDVGLSQAEQMIDSFEKKYAAAPDQGLNYLKTMMEVAKKRVEAKRVRPGAKPVETVKYFPGSELNAKETTPQAQSTMKELKADMLDAQKTEEFYEESQKKWAANNFTAADLLKRENRETLQHVLNGYADQLKKNFGITWNTEQFRNNNITGGAELYKYLLKHTAGSPEKSGLVERIQAKLNGWDKHLNNIGLFTDLMDKVTQLQEKLNGAPAWGTIEKKTK